MLRILHVVTHMNRGGLETMLMNYYRQIDRNKIQFDFLVHRYYRADYDDEIESLGGIIYRLPVLNPLDSKYKNALSSFFDEHPEYQIIHVHQDCMSSVILKEAEKHHVKVRIAHSHNSNQDKNWKYPIKLYYKNSISRYATDLFACNEGAGKWMFNGASFSILNNAVDAEKYRLDILTRKKVREELGVQDNQLVIGHVGRFNEVKNHRFLVEVFKEVLKQKDAILLLVGRGDLEEEIRKSVETSGIKDRVIFAGLRNDVDSLLQAMDVFVFPSLYEGLPMSLVEAQASGLPCVISDQVSPECMITKKTVMMSLKQSPAEWADRVISFSELPREDTYDAIVKSGFDIKKNAEELQEFYFSAANRE